MLLHKGGEKMKKLKIAFLSTYPPQECGIATFTYDLVNAIDKTHNNVETNIIAIEEKDRTYNFNNKVVFKIKDSDIETYMESADFINESDIDIVNIQHEFGLFGGESGSYIEYFVNALRKPIITTLHTVLTNPDELKKEITRFLVEKSEKVIVLSKSAIDILRDSYKITKDNIILIHHGVPEYDNLSKEDIKRKLGIENRFVLSTFGLINPGKGIEYALYALGDIKDKYPEILYLILGTTHPKVKRLYGEDYRNKLLKIVEELNLERNVVFVNKYLTKEELIEYLIATDVYITPYINREQICSGTLAYAIGFGKAIISTPYLYAIDMLSANRGILVDFKDSKSIAEALEKLIRDKNFLHEIERNAYELGKTMKWSNIAKQYVNVFKEVIYSKKVQVA